jgi:hypothetical protein
MAPEAKFLNHVMVASILKYWKISVFWAVLSTYSALKVEKLYFLKVLIMIYLPTEQQVQEGSNIS